MKTQSSKLPYFAAALTSIIFGFSFLFTKSVLDRLDTFHLLGLRFLTAALFLTLLKLTGTVKIKVRWENAKKLLIIALFQPVLYFIGETIGVGYTSASESSILIALVPIAATVLAVILIKERLSAFQWVSVLISVAGVILIVLANGNSTGSTRLWGVLALIGAVVAGGLYNVLSRKFSVDCTPMEVTYVMMWVGAVVFNLAGISNAVAGGEILNYFSSLWEMSVITGILYLGVVSSVGAFFLLNYALSKLEASKTAVFLNLIPVVTVLAGVFLKGETFHFLQCVGAVLVLAGIWGANNKPAALKKLNSNDSGFNKKKAGEVLE